MENNNTEYRPAGFWIRVAASIIDSVVAFLVSVIVGFLTVDISKLGEPSFSLFLRALIILAIFTWLISKKGGSPGKLLLGMVIVDSKTGLFLSVGKALLRETIGKGLSAFLLYLGFIMAGFRADKKALHDLIFKTQVVHKITN